MKHLTVILSLTLSFFFFSCDGTTDSPDNANSAKKDCDTTAATDTTADNVEEPEEVEAENFDEFYEQFVADKAFQLERVKFPLKGKSIDIDGEEEFTKENWHHMGHIDKARADKSLKTTIEKTDTRVSHSIFLPNSGFSIEYAFELGEDGKWYLTEKQETNF